jgi:hypothetical protein
MVTKNLLRIISIIIAVVTISVLLTSTALSNSYSSPNPSDISFEQDVSTSAATGYWYPVASPTTNQLEDISITPGSNGLDGWAVGWGNTFIRWNGSSWNTAAGPTGDFLNADFLAVAMVTATDGWATNAIEENTNQGKIYRWNGTTWSAATPLNAFQEALAVVPGSNGQDIWSAGWWGTILQWNGSAWSQKNVTNLLMLYGVDALTASDAWAVGGMHGQAETTGVLLHWNGANWVNVASPATGYWYHDVEMVSSNNVWVVGGNGTIIHWDGVAWSQVSSPTTERLYGISMVPGSNGTAGWAVGENGTTLFWNGSVWTNINSPVTGKGLLAVEMVSETDGWAVGSGGTILRYTVPQLTINYSIGAPGSYFNITGTGYPASRDATISVNGVTVGTVTTGQDGSFSITLPTAPKSSDGTYVVTIRINALTAIQSQLSTAPSTSIPYQLKADAPLRAKEGSLPVYPVPETIAPTYFVYLPVVIR